MNVILEYQDLNIYDCHHIYKEENKTIHCLTKKCICSLESIIGWSNLFKNVRKFNFEN